MEFLKIAKYRGFNYASDNQLYRRYSLKKETMYLKCILEECKGAAKISNTNNLLTITEPHSDHPSQELEIKQLTILEKCRKRAADDVVTPLKQIFDEEARTVELATVSFVNFESSMYKKRRLQQPALPLTAQDVADAIDGTRYSHVDGAPFFQGSVNAGKYVVFKIIHNI